MCWERKFPPGGVRAAFASFTVLSILLWADALHASIDAYWTNAAGGNWSSGSNWSTDPVWPNNQGPATYNATIDLPAGAPYSVRIDTQVSLDQFTLNSSAATVIHPYWNSYAVGTVNLLAGTYELQGGTIVGGIWSAAPGTFRPTSYASRMDGVTFNGDLDLTSGNADLRIVNGLTLNGTMHLTGPGSAVMFEGNQLFDNTSVRFGVESLYSSSYLRVNNGSLTFGPGATMSGGRGYVEGNGAFVNDGTIRADVPAAVLGMKTASLTNRGTLEAVGGAILLVGDPNETHWWNTATGTISATDATLRLDGTWSNEGTVSGVNSTVILEGVWQNAGIIDVADSTLYLGGAFTTDGIGTIQRSGGTVYIDGRLDNRDRTLILNGNTGSWSMRAQAQIWGGTAVQSEGAQLAFDNPGPSTLRGVQVIGDLHVNEYVFIYESLCVDGTILIDGDRGKLEFADELTLDDATIHLNHEPFGNMRGIVAQQGLTLGSNTIIRGAGSFRSPGRTVENHGKIGADMAGRVLQLDAGRISNFGRIEATNDATLSVGVTASSTVMWINEASGEIRADHGALLLLGYGANQGVIEARAASVYILHDFFNEGVLVLGPASTWTLHADYTQSPWAELVLDLDDGAPDVSDAVLQVAGRAQVGGMLSVALDGDSWLAVGDRFDFLTATSIVGAFDTEAFPDLPGDLYFELEYNDTGVALVVVPEPAGFVLLNVLAVALLRPCRGKAGLGMMRRGHARKVGVQNRNHEQKGTTSLPFRGIP